MRKDTGGGFFRFDTLDKKPHLYGLLIMSVIALAAAFILLYTGIDSTYRITSAMLCIYAAAALFMLARAFFRQLRYNPYSYNTIYYFGFFLFGLTVLISVVYSTVQIYSHYDINGLKTLVTVLMMSPRNFMVLSMPFVFIFAGMLVISNIVLIRKEGARSVNFLGIMLAAFMVAGEIIILLAGRQEVLKPVNEGIGGFLTGLMAALYLYFECMIIGTIAADMIAAFHEPDKNRDYLIVLGCALNKDGTPGNLLKGRLDRALKFYGEQKRITGKGPVFITSGGKGSDEALSESRSMTDYLISAGIPEDGIIREDRSANTFENMKFSKEIIDGLDKNAKIAFSTTNYHVFRSGLHARRVKMRAVGMGAPTKWYFWPNAAVREFAGLLTGHKGKQILIILGLTAFFVIAYAMTYGYLSFLFV
ncbi:MAG: YdcF family protein [Lachnospiraceae bacterium]|nr:YdcF family protein [Lachnospiraceae bacterium]